MYDIFISYRRIDTCELAHALYRDLRDRFGRENVFMDTSDSVNPWGSKWQTNLSEALEHCDALLALVGPEWLTCARRDGRRRLDIEDDWVRREIAAALKRDILVIPILFQGATFPVPEALPPDIRTLTERQCHARPMGAGSWDDELQALIGQLRTRESLRDLYDLTAANKGVPILKELYATNATVREAVASSRFEIGHVSEVISDLKVAKDVHDALHAIQAKCLGLLPRVDPHDRDKHDEEIELERARTEFIQASDVIREAAAAHADRFPQLAVLITRLTDASRKFDAAMQDATPAAVDALRYSLEPVLPRFLVEFDTVIHTLAAGVHVDELSRVVDSMRRALPAATLQTSAVKPLVQVSDALTAVGSRLTRLVTEHCLLQSLDMTVRLVVQDLTGRESGSAPDVSDVCTEWQAIELARARLTPPFSPELQKCGIDGLARIEAKLKAFVDAGDVKRSVRGLESYAEALLGVFWTFDSKLKELCSDLTALSEHFGELVEQGA